MIDLQALFACFAGQSEIFSATHKGQRFVVIAAKPYTRANGEPSMVLTWQAACAHPGCGKAFTFTTGRKLGYPLRRCPTHRRFRWSHDGERPGPKPVLVGSRAVVRR